MSFSNKEPLKEQIKLYKDYDELVFPDNEDIHKSMLAFLNLLSITFKNKDDADDYFTKNFVKDNRFSDDIIRIIKSQQPGINPEFQSVRKENIKEEYMNLLIKTGKVEVHNDFLKIKNSIEDEDIYLITGKNTLFGHFTERVTRGITYSSTTERVGVNELKEIIPELVSMKDTDFKDMMYWLKALNLESIVFFFTTYELRRRDEELTFINKNRENNYELMLTLNRFLTEMIIDVFYKDIINHFRKASFLIMHTDSSGEMSYEDLKEFKLPKGDFRDIAKSRYFKYVNEKTGISLIEKTKPIEEMTFSFAEYSKENKDKIRENINYLSETYYMKDFSGNIDRADSFIERVIDSIEDMLSLDLDKEFNLICERLSLSDDLRSDFSYFSMDDLFRLNSVVKRITLAEKNSREKRMKLSWLQKADETNEILDSHILKAEEEIKRTIESEAQ